MDGGKGFQDRASGELDDAQATVRDRGATGTADVTDRVTAINTGLKERAGNLARPFEGTGDSPATTASDGADDLANTADRPGDMESDAGGAGSASASSSADEFSSGGYTPGATEPADVAAAADSAPASDTTSAASGDNIGLPPAPSSGTNVDTDADGDASGGTGHDDQQGGGSTYASRVDDVTAGQDQPERAETPGSDVGRGGSLEDTPAATGQDPSVDPAPADQSAPPVYDEGGGGSSTIQPRAAASLGGDTGAGNEDGGTYAATPGDIAASGTSTSADLGISTTADLDATELGSLEEVEAPAATATATNAPEPGIVTGTGATDITSAESIDGDTPSFVPLGARAGADLSRTGLYADIRGDADTISVEDDDTSTTSGGRGAATARGTSAGAPGTPIEETLAAADSPVQVTGDPGNLEATAGDDYSAARSVEMTESGSPESTTSSAIGEEMASGEEADDLVGEPPAPAPAPGVAVDMDAESRPEASGRYAGAVRGDGTANTPPGYPIKGKGSSMIYHAPEMPSYRDTKPDWCFATEEDAIAAGFRAPRARNLAREAGPAAAAPAGSAGDTGSGIVDPHSVGKNPEAADIAPASDMTDSINRYSDPAVSGGGRLTEEVMDAIPGQGAPDQETVDAFGPGADDIESLQASSPDDAAASGDTSDGAEAGIDDDAAGRPGNAGTA